MYNPMCLWDEDDVDEQDRTTKVERDPVSGTYRKVTKYKDGSSREHSEAMCGDRCSDENGEEC